MKHLIVLSGAVLILACGGTVEQAGKDEMTQRQRDSAIAESNLPGAAGVGRALQVADSAAARQRMLEEIDP